MKRRVIALNLVLGPLVLASYVASGVYFDASVIEGLWGRVPEAARGVYTANMFLAAAGYFAFGNYFLRHLEPDRVRVLGRGFGLVPTAYAAMLIGSIVWMPLTCVALARSLPWLTPLIVVDLAIVALASLALLGAVVTATPPGARGARLAAIVGAGFFCVQTVALDAVVWVICFV